MNKTKTWVVTIELELEEDSHPRKWISETISEALKPEVGEDITHLKYVCLD